MLEVVTTRRFDRDYAKLQSSNNRLEKFEAVILLLMEEKPLEPRHKDHALKGNMKGWRDCHIEGDWVLIYKVENRELVLSRTGTHNQVFNK